MAAERAYSVNRQASSRVYLMAEDNPADAALFTEMLEQVLGADYSVVCVDSFASIQQALSFGTFEALILDMNLPDRSGVDNVTHLGSRFPDLPIVVLTGNDDLDMAVESLQRGAQDYLSKNHVTPEILKRSLRYARERKQIDLRLRQAPADSDQKNVQLQQLAQHDYLTKLPNRAYFEISAARMLSRAARLKKQVALLYIDLNGFKAINDSFGHAVGDQLLIQTAERLNARIRQGDLVARLGGDEFVVMTDLLDSKQEVYGLVNRVVEAFDAAFNLDKSEVSCAPSVGVAFYPEAISLTLLMKQADRAMYEAKVNRHVPVCFFTRQLEQTYNRNLLVETHVVKALAAGEFTVVFQVVGGFRDTGIHAEALLRWNSSELGIVSPNEFIPVVEGGPLMNELTHLVFQRTADFIQALQRDGHDVGRININLSASQLASRPFIQRLLGWLEELHIAPDMICLELTEREMVRNTQLCNQQLAQLRALDIGIALDDFGTGYSSIKSLIDMPIDYLKLDRILVDNIDNNLRIQALTVGVIEMAHRLGIQVVAEGVERREELETIRRLGCDYWQGYLLAMPARIEDVLQRLSSTEFRQL
jgi:diguanylate cyclase (GGDEF)-like protein